MYTCIQFTLVTSLNTSHTLLFLEIKYTKILVLIVLQRSICEIHTRDVFGMFCTKHCHSIIILCVDSTSGFFSARLFPANVLFNWTGRWFSKQIAKRLLTNVLDFCVPGAIMSGFSTSTAFLNTTTFLAF